MSPTQPPVLWFNGALVPWETATIHVWSEYGQRGASVFEGIRAYYNGEDGRHYAVALHEHMARLQKSARGMRLPPTATSKELVTGMHDLVAALGIQEDLYLRPTLYIAKGRYAYRADQAEMGAFIVGFPSPSSSVPEPITCGISSWRRPAEQMVSPLVKAGGNYLGNRLSIIEAQEHGFSDAILLNDRGNVAEATGAVVFMVRDGVVSTPPLSAGILDSITRRIVLELCESHALSCEIRDISRAELDFADELFLAGTLAEVQPISSLEGSAVGAATPGPVTYMISERYREIYRGGSREPRWLTRLGGSGS
ncbi:aminotransferase class IV [Streptomyces sp. NPDC020747]|uniref:aminotransferase class IV n=1 Tax=Streptomyces sp. NPDC020747 TaxID=3365086 RepID=UPI0037898E6C